MTDLHSNDADRPLQVVNRPFPDLGDPERAKDVPGTFNWIDGLPIACAVVRFTDNEIDVVAGNDEFVRLMMGSSRESKLDHGALCGRVRELVESGEKRLSYSWLSPDQVQSRRLDITIMRYEADDNLLMISMHDRTSEIAGQINLRREMLSDSLTGFANRTGFEERIDELIKRSDDRGSGGPRERFAIVIFDLARFSRINECVGAMAGDELIITAARRIRAVVRRSDLLARLGGNEFGLFLRLGHDGGAGDLDELVRRVTLAFEQPCRLSDLEIKVECAFGAALGEVGTDDPMEVIRYAQIALKRAKASSRFEIYAPGTDMSIRRRFSLETDLRRAIGNGDLELHYQPFLHLGTGALAGFEALARWDHPRQGWVSPTEFIAVAEESGLIVPLGRWALDEAARTIAIWNSMNGREVPFRVAVNLSACQLQRDDVAEAVGSALRGARISGRQMALELTESAFVADPDGTCRALEALKALDTRIALDDFGTGYSNLAYLQRLPIDVLKIDRSFVNGMNTDKDKRAIVETIIALARSFGISTTAEGIESAELGRLLASLGCNYGQGHFYSRALARPQAWQYYCSLPESAAA